MKKFLALLCCILCSLCVSTSADTLVCDSFEYELMEDGTAELGLYVGAPGANVVIPVELDGHLIMSVSDNPFWQTPVASVTVAENHPYFVMVDGVLFGKSDNKLVYYPKDAPESAYEIPDGTKYIGNHAFYECKNLHNCIAPSSVKVIGVGAFMNSGLGR